ncbi:MAG TPA: hypothetical protein PKD83_08555 [Ignavibacteria bacterium]|nr:hypothetical protein [Ignavibacteria bacterium]
MELFKFDSEKITNSLSLPYFFITGFYDNSNRQHFFHIAKITLPKLPPSPNGEPVKEKNIKIE